MKKRRAVPLNLHFQIPRFAASTVDAGPSEFHPVLDGRDVVVPNRWKLPPHTVALAGRRAVFIALDVLGRHAEIDFGGHLYVIVTDAHASHATIIEAGPMHPNGSGALVPYEYPEDRFETRHIADFDPEIVEPPHGLGPQAFCDLVRRVHRAYDGDQRYLAVEIPFFRVGRDSNSYAMGVLLGSCVDPRALPKGPRKARHRELIGYPGAEDPVHRGNFGVYPGAPSPLPGGACEQAIHDERGDVMAVIVGGAPNARVRLPGGGEVTLDGRGRIVLGADDARRRGLPSRRTEPPEHIRTRRHFPHDPSPQGAWITLLHDGKTIALMPGDRYRGTITWRNEALGLATLAARDGEIVLPLPDLGVELRDPKRVDALFHVGNEVTVGLHRDRHPKLDSHGSAGIDDFFLWKRLHAPRPIEIALSVALGAGACAIAGAVWLRLRRA